MSKPKYLVEIVVGTADEEMYRELLAEFTSDEDASNLASDIVADYRESRKE